MAWAAIGGAAVAIGAPLGVGLGVWGATSHLWSHDAFLAGFAAACALTALGVYVLTAEFIGGIGPIKFPLPLTRREREAGLPMVAPRIRRVAPSPALPAAQLRRPAQQPTPPKRRPAQPTPKVLRRPPASRAAGTSQKEPVSNEHRDMLKGVAACLLRYVRASQAAYYGKKGDERKAQAFQEHFPEIRGQVDTWNARIDARERARDELRRWVAGRLHALHYDQAPFSGGLDNPITAEALADAPRLNFKEVHGCLHIGPYPVVVLPSMKTLDPSWAEIPKVNRGRVEHELQEIAVEAAGREERHRARDADKSLTEVSDPLVNELELIGEKDVIRGLGDCQLCRG